MCEKCLAAVQKYYPNLSEADQGSVLWGATCFPLGSPEMVEKQLKEVREATDGTLGAALAYAENELWKAMEEIP